MQEGRLIMTEAEVDWPAAMKIRSECWCQLFGVTFTGEYEPVEAV